MEDRKTKEIIRILFAMQKRPGMYFGSPERRSYSALSMFLAGYGCGARAIGEEEIYWGTMDGDVRREFMNMTEGKDYSDQEQFDIFFEALNLVLRRDYPQYLEEFKQIKACCPNCHAFKDKIVYQNSGPIVRIYCSECGLVYNESNAKKAGYADVIDFWNEHIGVYFPQD